jgi:hypothetical protein
VGLYPSPQSEQNGANGALLVSLLGSGVLLNIVAIYLSVAVCVAL